MGKVYEIQGNPIVRDWTKGGAQAHVKGTMNPNSNGEDFMNLHDAIKIASKFFGESGMA